MRTSKRVYLCNGKDGYGNSLNVLYNGKLVRDFADIALLDCITMQIPANSVDAYFKGLNPNNDLSGKYYVCSKDLEDLYLPVFRPNNPKSLEYMNILEQLAISRCNNIDRCGKAGNLDSRISYDTMRRILINIYRLNDDDFYRITNKYTAMSDQLQIDITKKNFGENKNRSVEKYVDHLLKSDYHNKKNSYTLVRNLVLAYSRLIDNQDTTLNCDEIRDGYTDFTGNNEVVKQLSMFDYM